MTGSNSSIHGDRYGEEEPHVARAELRQMAHSLLQAMERMLDARIPGDGRRAPWHQYDESGAENSDAGHDLSEMVVVVAGGLVIMAKMEDELMAVVVAVMFILMMKNLVCVTPNFKDKIECKTLCVPKDKSHISRQIIGSIITSVYYITI